jgi:acetyl esterase
MPDDAELDPEVAALLELAEERPQPPAYALSVEGARARLEELFADQAVRDVGAVEEFPIAGPDGGIPTRLYLPEASVLETEAGLPALVYYHGGGWTVGDLDTHDNVCRALCEEAGVAVLSVDYRLGPEEPFPAALHDAYAAYEWARAYGDRVGVDADRVAVGGDSAGGNLSAAVSLYAADEGDPVPDYQLLVYPAVASRDLHEFESYEENAEGYLLERASTEWYDGNYVDDPAHRRNAYVAPLLADDRSGQPPATVVTAGLDPLRDEGRAYADALEADGIAVRREHYPGQVHGFVSFTEYLSAARESLATMGEHLAEELV